MMLMVIFFIMLMLILMLMLMMNFMLSKKMFKNREKSSPFECGFDPLSMNRMPFSLQFYLISIIFLIFDVEIAMILPMVKSESFMNYWLSLNFMLIMIILIFGLFLEWGEGALNWFK